MKEKTKTKIKTNDEIGDQSRSKIKENRIPITTAYNGVGAGSGKKLPYEKPKDMVICGGNDYCSLDTDVSGGAGDVYSRWEKLPSMPITRSDCTGISYRNKFVLLGHKVRSMGAILSYAFDPSTLLWGLWEDVWPFSRKMDYMNATLDSGKMYIIVDWGNRSIKMRDDGHMEWKDVGSIPRVSHGDARPPDSFGYGFVELAGYLYVVEGKCMQWGEELGKSLYQVWTCNPTILPLQGREGSTNGLAKGVVIGCAALEEGRQMNLPME